MGNTNGKIQDRVINPARIPRPSVRRYVFPFDATVYDTSGEGNQPANFAQIASARKQLEEPETWRDYIESAFRGAGVPQPRLYNLQVRLIVEEGENLKGTVSWIAPDATLPLLRHELDWFLNDRMNQYELTEEHEQWWCSVRAGVASLRVGYPRLDDFPLRVAQPAWMTELEEPEQQAQAQEQLQEPLTA